MKGMLVATRSVHANHCNRSWHLPFFYSTALGYRHKASEKFRAEPGPDPFASFQVTEGSSHEWGMDSSVTAAAQPQGSISAHFTRGKNLTVEQQVGTWSLSISEQSEFVLE